MCRLFGLTAGTTRVSATFWLLDAPDSMEVESHRNVDGAGIGFFDQDGEPVLDKQPESAYEDSEWIREAKQVRSAQLIAHVRWATAGGRSPLNTHPFTMNGRIMAHNGGFGSLPVLDSYLGAYARLVQGDTDSERFFALITKETDAHDGDVGAGITAAARWIAANLPLSSLNTIVAAPGELWALRYPAQHALHIIEHPSPHLRSTMSTVHVAGSPPSAASPTSGLSAPGTTPPGASVPGVSVPAASVPDASVPAASAPAASAPAASAPDALTPPPPTVVIASEELDSEPGWRMLTSGELIHVTADLTVHTTLAVPDPPAHLIPLPAANPNIDT
jgi:predicted glutamine amidotransferase